MAAFLSGIPLLRLLVCLLMLAGPGLLHADIKTSPGLVRVPLAQPGKAVAVRGFPVEIRLEGKTSTTRMLKFIIRQQPKQGRLEGPPVEAGRETAVVRYTANPASTAEVDTIVFATKEEGSGSSEDATITIRLVDPAPVLDAPGGLDLGRILTAEALERNIVIANKGNASWQATVPLPVGWSWLVPAGGVFDLAPGEQAQATLRVKVAEPGEVDEKVTLRPGSVVRVIGKAAPPFLAYPSLLRLQWDRVEKQRAWRLTLRNNSPAVLTVRVTGPPGLLVPESVTVPSAESLDIAVAWPGALNQPVSGRIVLEAPSWRQEVEFESPVAPAAVDLTGAAEDGTVDFGIMEKAEGASAMKRIALKNVGGTAATVRWDPLKFFVLEGLEPVTVLAPQAERQFTLRPRPDEPGRLKEELLLTINGGDRVLKLTADIDPSAAKSALMQGTVLEVKTMPRSGEVTEPKVVSGDGLRLRTQILSGGLMKAFPNKDISLPSVDTVRFLEAESAPDKLVFEWNAPAPGKWTYHVMVRMLRNHGPMQAPIPEYDEMENVKVTTTPTGGRAVVTQLRPQMRWFCRIVSVREDGVSTKAGEEMIFFTPPVPDSRWGWRLLGVLGVISLALYIRQKWREDVKWKD